MYQYDATPFKRRVIHIQTDVIMSGRAQIGTTVPEELAFNSKILLSGFAVSRVSCLIRYFAVIFGCTCTDAVFARVASFPVPALNIHISP